MTKAKAAAVRTLDFSDVQERGNFNPRRKKEGEWIAKLVEVVDHESKAGEANLLYTVQIEGDRRASYPVYCGLAGKQLWKLRALIAAVGMKAPTGRSKVDPTKLLNRLFVVILEDDEYEGRVKSTVADFLPLAEGKDSAHNKDVVSGKAKGRVVEDDDEDEEDDEEDEPPAKKAKPAKASGKKRPVDEDEEEDDDEDEDEEPPAKKSSKKAPASKPSKKRPVEDDDDEDEDEEDDEPAPKKSKSAKKPAKKGRRSTSDDEDDDLDMDEL